MKSGDVITVFRDGTFKVQTPAEAGHAKTDADFLINITIEPEVGPPCPHCGQPHARHSIGKDLKPIPKIEPCHFCGSSKVHRHGTNPDFIVLTHEPGCEAGHRIHVHLIGGGTLERWNARKAKPAEAST
jgi:hypothetical protein